MCVIIQVIYVPLLPTDGCATDRPPTAGGRRMCLLSGAQRRVLCPADGPHLPAQLVPRLPQAAGVGGGAGGHGRLPRRVRRFRAGGECRRFRPLLP